MNLCDIFNSKCLNSLIATTMNSSDYQIDTVIKVRFNFFIKK